MIFLRYKESFFPLKKLVTTSVTNFVLFKAEVGFKKKKKKKTQRKTRKKQKQEEKEKKVVFKSLDFIVDTP